jgi:cytochrome P450
VVGAGAATIACWLSVATYRLLMSPSILAKLKAELNDVIPDLNIAASFPILEKLPYLNAVVQQALRLIYGVSSRL